MSVLADYYKALTREANAKAEGDLSAADASSRASAAQRAATGQNAQSQADEASARAAAARASAGLTNTQAGQLPLNDAAIRAAQTAGANLDQTKINSAPLNDQLLRGQIAGQNLQNYLTGYGSGLPGTGMTDPATLRPAGASSGGTAAASPRLGGGFGPIALQNPQDTQGLAKGGMVAQGKASKPGPTDTVPTMLTPGEAVLNRGAAEHYGSDVIDHMNKMGLMRMAAASEVAKAHGLPDPNAAPPKASRRPKGKPEGHAKGTAAVGKGKAPAAGTPELQALVSQLLGQHLQAHHQMMTAAPAGGMPMLAGQ